MQPCSPVYCSGKRGRNVYGEISVLAHRADHENQDTAANAGPGLPALGMDSQRTPHFVNLCPVRPDTLAAPGLRSVEEQGPLPPRPLSLQELTPFLVSLA